MVSKFVQGKLYKFSYEYFKENYTGALPISIHDKWAKKYDGKLVTKIISEVEGEITVDALNLSIEPSWCDEIVDVDYTDINENIIKVVKR